MLVRDFSKERKVMQANGTCPMWMTTAGWQLFSEKYLNGGCKTPLEQYKRIAYTIAEHAPDEYPEWWNEIDYCGTMLTCQCYGMGICLHLHQYCLTLEQIMG